MINEELTEEQRNAELARRVSAGAELLSEKYNAGHAWYFAVRTDELNIAIGDRCILGQLYGGYLDGLEALGLGLGIEHGFAGFYEKELTDLWKARIRELREAHVH